MGGLEAELDRLRVTDSPGYAITYAEFIGSRPAAEAINAWKSRHDLAMDQESAIMGWVTVIGASG